MYPEPPVKQLVALRIEVVLADGGVKILGTLSELQVLAQKAASTIEGIHYYQPDYRRDPNTETNTAYTGPVAIISNDGTLTLSTRPRQRGQVNFDPLGDLLAALDWMDAQDEA